MTGKRFKGAIRDMWWIAVITLCVAPVVWFFVEPWIACFMPPFAVLTILYFAVFRYDDDGNERSDL